MALLLLQLLVVLARELLNDALMRLHQQRVLLVPALVEHLLLLQQLLVALHLRHDLLLVLHLQRRHLLRVALLALLELLLVLHLLLVLLLQQQLELGLVAVQLRLELVRQVLDLLVQVQVLQPQLVLVLQRQLVDLQLQLLHARALLLQVALGHQHLLGVHQRLLVLAHTAPLLVAHVEHEQTRVLAHAEQQRVVRRDAHARDGPAVALELLELAAQRELVGPHRARLARREQHLPAGRKHHLRQHVLRGVLLADLVGLVELLQLLVAAHGVDVAAVGGGHHARVVAPLDDVLLLALEVLELPLVHGAVQPGAHDLGVVRAPAQRPHLAVVPAQVAHVLARVHVVDLDHVAVHGGEVVPAVAEHALLALLDAELFVRPDVVHQQVHQPQLVREPHQHMQAAGVERDGVRLLGEELHELAGLLVVVPDAHALVGGARGHQRLAHAHVHARDALGVEPLGEQVEVHLLALEDVAVAQAQHVHLVVLQRADQVLLRRAQRQVLDAHAVVLDAERLGALVQLLVLRPLVDAQHAVVAAADEPLAGERDDAVDAHALGRRRDGRLELVVLNQQQLAAV
mmetsp:Transcript_30134/g.74777  ORF Transcript_30134/g.74777 Transcript_30134/m.74777 type:complete len:573 (-) Transcript_30134:780-2498(-)